MKADWLRWLTADGQVVPTAQEREAARPEAEAARAARAEARADEALRRVAELEARLAKRSPSGAEGEPTAPPWVP